MSTPQMILAPFVGVVVLTVCVAVPRLIQRWPYRRPFRIVTRDPHDASEWRYFHAPQMKVPWCTPLLERPAYVFLDIDGRRKAPVDYGGDPVWMTRAQAEHAIVLAAEFYDRVKYSAPQRYGA